MKTTVLRAGTYEKKPWKNGGGTTEDVWIVPQGAGHDDFDIRLSLATIDRDGPFSAFPGIDRTITLVGGDAFVLDFGNGRQQRMDMLQPFSFDSALTPSSRLTLGPSHDFNVMTRAGRWRHEVKVVRDGGIDTDLAASSIAVVHVVAGVCDIGTKGTLLSARDTGIVSEPGNLKLQLPPGSSVLLAIIQPAA